MAQVVFYGKASHEAAVVADKLGFQHVYQLEEGSYKGPIQRFLKNHSPWVHPMLDTETETAQYIVTDLGKI